MLALQQAKRPLDKCSPNILPCRINYNGHSKVTKRFWSPSLEKGTVPTKRTKARVINHHAETAPDKTRTAYFRGRRLRGRTVKLPEGYEGIVVNSTDRVLPNELTNTRPAVPEGSDSEDLEDERAGEPIKILEAVATFDDVTVWGHDQVPSSDDAFVKGIEEWIAFAEAIHSQTVTEEPSKRSSD